MLGPRPAYGAGVGSPVVPDVEKIALNTLGHLRVEAEHPAVGVVVAVAEVADRVLVEERHLRVEVVHRLDVVGGDPGGVPRLADQSASARTPTAAGRRAAAPLAARRSRRAACVSTSAEK